MRAFNGALGVAPCDGLVSPAYSVFDVLPTSDSRYLAYVLRSAWGLGEIAQRIRGIGQVDQSNVRTPTLATTDLGQIVVGLPSLSTQRAVADYLDRETGALDALIEKKRRLASLLEEYELSSLSHRLIPAGAQFAKLRRFATIQGGMTVDSGRELGTEPVTRPYLRVANVQDGRLALESVVDVTVPAALAARCTLRPHDVLMTEGGDIDKLGRGTVWRGELPDCLHQNHVFAVRPNAKLDGEYLALVTRTAHARCYFERTGTRSTNLASTSSSKIMDLPVPVLSLADQRSIVADWHAQHHGIEEAQTALVKQADLIRERRQALLTAAITGQLDVREAAS